MLRRLEEDQGFLGRCAGPRGGAFVDWSRGDVFVRWGKVEGRGSLWGLAICHHGADSEDEVEWRSESCADVLSSARNLRFRSLLFTMPIGPALPPHLAHLARSTAPEDDAPEAGPSVPRSTTPEDDYGPALPPHLAAKRKAPVGPAAPWPAAPSAAVGPSRPACDDDSDDDVVVGPMPSAEVGPEKSAVQEFMEREERKAREREVSNEYTPLTGRTPASQKS